MPLLLAFRAGLNGKTVFQGTSPLAGKTGLNIHLGFKVEKDKITGRVKNTMVADNALEVLNDIKALSKKAEWVNGRSCKSIKKWGSEAKALRVKIVPIKANY